MEWLCVLGYRHLPLDADSRPKVAAEFDSLISCISDLTPRIDIRLPLCKDKDDQKFLELARDADAQTLITKDKALLKLARKTARDGLFGIIPPEAWVPDF
jgi:predicted nucleic acid-binding protein